MNNPLPVFFTLCNDINGFSTQIIFNFVMHNRCFKHFSDFSFLLRHVLRHGTCIQFPMKYSLSILCYELFECNGIIETTAAHFFQARWLTQKCFLTNYTEQKMNLKLKKNLKKLACNDLYSTKKKRDLNENYPFVSLNWNGNLLEGFP